VDDSRAEAYVDLGYIFISAAPTPWILRKFIMKKALLLDPKNTPANNNMGRLLRSKNKTV
jgi:hypothetical protein